jgi:hypothetical protein
LRVQATKPPMRFEVTCDGDGIAGHTGAALLGELADRLGLTRALSWRAGRGETPRHRHNAGAVLRDLAVLLADGGDCLSDLAVLRQQPELFGPVASTPTAWRVMERVAGDPDGLLALMWTARCWMHPRQSRVRPGPTRAASGSIRCWRTWTVAMVPARRSPVCCGRATPAPTPPKITSTWSTWRSPSCPPPPVPSRCWSAPTPAAPPTPWSSTYGSVACGSRSACQPTSASAPPCWPCP